MLSDSVFDLSTATVELPTTTNLEVATPDIEETEVNAEDESIEEAVAAQASLHRDPYTISEDGHFVGHDGFIVPKDFEEFNARFPNVIRGFVRRKMLMASREEIQDRIQDLNVHLMSLPEKSKYRKPGFNGLADGCKDRIQVFHPERNAGANGARFMWYINLCLANHLASLTRKAGSNPIMRYNTLSMYSTDPEGEIVDDDYIYRLSSEAFRNGCNYDQVLERGIHLNEFISFVEEHNPELIPVIEAIAQTDTYVEVQRMLGMTEKLLIRARNRIGVLYASFKKGAKPPRQRKIYRPRNNAVFAPPITLDNLAATVV